MPIYDKSSVEESYPVPATSPVGDSIDEGTPASAAVERFRSCRWRRAADNGNPECCGHRDVLPLTGTHGFDPEAWCEECSYYKLRRTPKKRDYQDRY